MYWYGSLSHHVLHKNISSHNYSHAYSACSLLIKKNMGRLVGKDAKLCKSIPSKPCQVIWHTLAQKNLKYY